MTITEKGFENAFYTSVTLLIPSDQGSQLGAFFPKVKGYYYLKFKLHFLKDLKLFYLKKNNKIELFLLIVLQRKPTDFFSFNSIFLRNQSLRNTGSFYRNKKKMDREIRIELKMN